MKRLLALIGVLCFALFAFRTLHARENDFVAYYQAGSRVLSGLSPYVATDGTPFRYLPVTAYLFAPLSLLSMNVARFLFFCANFAATIWIYEKTRRQLGNLSTLLLLVLFFRFHNHDFQNAQVNPLLLLLLFIWWKLREQRLAYATLAFALFASFKIVPFALCLPLLYFRRWRELFYIGAWTLGLNLVPAFLLDSGFKIFGEWLVQAGNLGFPVPMMANIQSLPSALWWNLQTIVAPETFASGVTVLRVTLLLLVLAYAPGKKEAERMDWMIALLLAMTALLTPLAWKHNYLQFLPLACLWFRYDPQFRETRTRMIYGFSLFGLVVLPSLLSAWDLERSNRLYVMVWAGLAAIFASLRYFRSRNGFESYPRPL